MQAENLQPAPYNSLRTRTYGAIACTIPANQIVINLI